MISYEVGCALANYGKCLSMGSMMEDFKVKNVKDSNKKFYVEFKGPPESKLDFHCFSFFKKEKIALLKFSLLLNPLNPQVSN